MGEPPTARLDHIFSQGCQGLRFQVGPLMATPRPPAPVHREAEAGVSPAGQALALPAVGPRASCSQGQSIPGVQASLPLT